MNLSPADHAGIRHILTGRNQGADFNDSDHGRIFRQIVDGANGCGFGLGGFR